MKEHEELINQEVDTRSSHHKQRSGNPYISILGTTKPSKSLDTLVKIEDLIADENLSPSAKIKKIKKLVEQSILTENNLQVITDIADEVAKLSPKPSHSIMNYFFQSEDPCKPIMEMLLERYLVLLMKDIDDKIIDKNIDISSDQAVVIFNGIFGTKTDTGCSKELRTLMQLAGKSSVDLYESYRRELTYEIAQRFEDIQRDVYDYEKNMEGAMVDVGVSGVRF